MANWLPDDFVVPERVAIGDHHHLRPIRESDVDLDYPAVMGSRNRLWSIYGDVWGWPPETMTFEADRTDLRYHEDEAAARSSFNFALFDTDETRLLGCCYIDPPEAVDESRLPTGIDAVINWWVVNDLVGTEVEATMDAVVPQWIGERWPFHQPHFGIA